MSHWYDSVKPGDLVVADPLWNETTIVRYLRLPPVSEVLRVNRGVRGCQTGVLLSVRGMTGWTVQLDAGRFRPHETAQETAQT